MCNCKLGVLSWVMLWLWVVAVEEVEGTRSTNVTGGSPSCCNFFYDYAFRFAFRERLGKLVC